MATEQTAVAPKTAVLALSSSGVELMGNLWSLPLEVLRSTIRVNKKTFSDIRDVDAQRLLPMLKPGAKTSVRFAELSDALQTLLDLRGAGVEEALVITPSVEVSQCFWVYQEIPGLLEGRMNVTVYDSKTAGPAEGYMALHAAQMALEGRSVEDITASLDVLGDNCETVFCLDSPGRMSKEGLLSLGPIASGLLGMKPLASLRKGRLSVLGKFRKADRAAAALAEWLNTRAGAGQPVSAILADCCDGSERERFLRQIKIPLAMEIELPASVAARTGPILGAAVFAGYKKLPALQ